MADKTKISWADATWNPIIGCSKISAGCANCYAERMALRLAAMECFKPYAEPKYLNVVTADKATKGWTGQTLFVESALTKPLHWRKPRKIFVCSMSDLFHESVPFEWINAVVAIVTECHWHEFVFLTKRSEIMQRYFAQPDLWTHIIPDAMHKYLHHPSIQEPAPAYHDFSAVTHQIIPPLHNLHLGVTVETQDNVGRILDLVKTPRSKGFISFEPLLGRIDCPRIDAVGRGPKNVMEDISYAFVGCESGPGARLCKQEDIRHIMWQCRNADVKIHVKQIPLNGTCNKNITEWPEEFRVREV